MKTQEKRNQEACASSNGTICTQAARRERHYAEMDAYKRRGPAKSRSVKRSIDGRTRGSN